METPVGKAFVTVNENGNDSPFEVFINTAKAGSDIAAVSEAIGRLISYILRLDSPILPRARLLAVVDQLKGIGGSRPIGFGPNRVASLPDGVAQVLAEFLNVKLADPPADSSADSAPKIGDLCPECGQSTLVREEGCEKCLTCGFSKC